MVKLIDPEDVEDIKTKAKNITKVGKAKKEDGQDEAIYIEYNVANDRPAILYMLAEEDGQLIRYDLL